MHEFIAKHENHIAGVLSGFDRLVFRGTLRSISWAEGMNHYLHANDVLLKDIGTHVERVSQRLKQASLAGAECTARPDPVSALGGNKQGRDRSRDRIARQHREWADLCSEGRGTVLDF